MSASTLSRESGLCNSLILPLRTELAHQEADGLELGVWEAEALQQLAAQKKAKPGQKAPLKKKATATAKKAFTALKKQKNAEIKQKQKAALKAAEERVKQLPKKQQSAARKKAKTLIKKQFDAKKKLIPKSTKGMGLPEIGTAIKRLKVMKV